MIITFPDGTILDTAGMAGFIQFDTNGTITLSGNNLYSPPTTLLWSRLQQAITAGLRSGAQSLSFYPEAPPVITAASPSAFANADQPIIVLTGSGFQPGMAAGIDYSGINGSGLPFVPVVLTVVSASKAWFACPTLGNPSNTLYVTVINPDGGVAVFSGFTVG